MFKQPTTNVALEQNFTQVCVWPGCIVDETDLVGFHHEFQTRFGIKVQYLEQIEIFPDFKDIPYVKGTAHRTDLFFAIHKDDIAKFAPLRFEFGIRWVEDVMINHTLSRLYPSYVLQYCNKNHYKSMI